MWSVWLFLLSIILSKFIYGLACISTSFVVWLNNIPSYGYVPFYLFISRWAFGLFSAFGYYQ